jgi:hypothetical protein
MEGEGGPPGEATVDELTREDVTVAADAVLDDLFEAAAITRHPIDAVALARHLGLVLTPESPGRGRGAGGLRPVPTAERLQWAAAQEVAVRLRPAFLLRLGLSEEGPRPLFAESPTNLLALRLLLPTAWFTASARECGYDVLELHALYATASPAQVAWRLLDLAEPCVISVVDNGTVTQRRSNAWRVPRGLTEAEAECQRYVHHYSRPRRVRARGWDVHGWPIHQVDWKREILRGVVEEEATDGDE